MTDRARNVAVYGAYYLTLAAMLVASFFPEHRVWGINWWAYYPSWVRWGLFGFGVVAPGIIRLYLRRLESDADKNTPAATDRGFLLLAGIVTLVSGALFYFMRARTHFLGDGYQLLSLLADRAPTFTKPTETGEALIHLWLRNALDGRPEQSALLSYQVISILAGLIFVMVVALFARALFQRTLDRVLFLLGVCSGGYMLLFCGYVENYSLFVLSVLVYTLTGLLVCEAKISKWWLLVPLAAALFLHVIGMTLIPSAVYAFTAPTRLGHGIARWRPSAKLPALLLVVATGGAVFYHFYTTSYFFRFAFVPFLDNRFTVEGYTLFSWKHLADYLNLLILLLPGLPVVLALFFVTPARTLLKQRESVYLTLLLLSVLGAVFIFDPKLGMARDWDLFSYAGVPLAVLAFRVVIHNLPRRFRAFHAPALLILLGFLALLPRAVSLVVPEVSLRHFRNYTQLDVLRSRTAYALLIKYYEHNGDVVSARMESANWETRYPQRQMVEDARVLASQGRVEEAITICNKVIDRDPAFSLAYYNLAGCYLLLDEPARALKLARIARGMNPFDACALYLQGVAHATMGNEPDAETAWREATALSDTLIDPRLHLLDIYRKRNDHKRYVHLLLATAVMDQAPLNVIRESGDYHLAQRAFAKSADAYRRALQKGLDSAYVEQLMQRYPQLREHFK